MATPSSPLDPKVSRPAGFPVLSAPLQLGPASPPPSPARPGLQGPHGARKYHSLLLRGAARFAMQLLTGSSSSGET